MIYDSIIIGKGPAGISAGIYIKRAGLNVLIIGKDGGALEKTNKIDNYYGFVNTISGKELLNNGINQAIRLGIQVETDEVVGLEYDENYIVKTRNNEFYSKSLIIATGTKRNTPNIKGIAEYEGKGVSYCAICDAFFYRNKEVVVLGEGDYALSEAKELSKVANKVTILTNGKELIENRSIDTENIEVDNRSIKEVVGEVTVNKVRFSDNSELSTHGVFVAIGTASSTDLARKLGILVENNNIIVDENMSTNIQGVFACGDCTGGLLQISKAVYEGSKAGLKTVTYIRERKR